SFPTRKYFPLVGVSKAPKICINVDLPEPDGPIIATNSPVSILKLTPWRALKKTSPSRYDLVTIFTLIMWCGVYQLSNVRVVEQYHRRPYSHPVPQIDLGQ